MARRILTDLSIEGDLDVTGSFIYDDVNSEVSASVTYGDLKGGPTGYVLIQLGESTVRIPYYS